jgi:hypothetical protein
MKLCKDCKYIELPIKTFSDCKHPKSGKVSKITGETKYGSASSTRIGDWLSSRILKSCGEKARWFEPKYVPARERSS